MYISFFISISFLIHCIFVIVRQNQEEEFNRLLNEERQRCDALANDNDSMIRLLEETRTQNKDELTKKNQDIEQLNSQIDNLKIEVRIEWNIFRNSIDSILD